jgi:tetratricopeptide (TPR) repeat protein/pimeloyl-ACP methyl ester carboxylesterase
MAQIIFVGSGSGNQRASVIFLHGLGGDPNGTWRIGSDDRSFWPRWLSEDIPGLAVYSAGYEASISRWRGTAMHLTDRATNVLARLLAEPHLQTNQLILIGHSLGGLLIKQLLRTAESEARHNANAAKFLERVDKVAFLATPHTGADLASWGDRLRIFVRPSAATICLARNDPNLRDLNFWYRDWANARGMSHLTLTETDPIRILGMIVKPDNGDPGLSGSRPVSISSNHWTICKPVDRSADTYVLIRKFIESSFERPKNLTDEKLEAMPDIVVAKLMAALNERGEAISAEKAGVSRQVIIQLAQRINADVADFDQALRELERAVGIAVEVAEEGRRGSNAGDFVDVVLARIAEKSAEGRFDEAAKEADAAFVQWEREQAERRGAALVSGLKLVDAGLRQDILRRDPVSAAKRIERMVALENPDNRDARVAVLRARQWDWYERGRDQGLNLDLLVSIETARLLIASASGPNEVGFSLNVLGISSATLGERERGSVHLIDAIDAYRAALREYTRESNPLKWALTEVNLGVTLMTLGQRESDTARLEDAVEAFRAGLQEYTRERDVLNWAKTQINLGGALVALGTRASSSARLEEAVDAFRAALQENIRESVPLEWAAGHMNLGTALMTLGEREFDAARVQEAVEAYRAALQENTREHVPLQWAAVQNNLGGALYLLGILEDENAHLKEAIDAFRAALQEYTRERATLDWAMTQANLGSALTMLGERESGTKTLEEAVDAHRAALQEYTRESVPLGWARTQTNLANALSMLGERESGTARLKEAVDTYRVALQECTRERVPLDWARTQIRLGYALTTLGERELGTAHLEEAADAYRAALQEYTRESNPEVADEIQKYLLSTTEMLSRRQMAKTLDNGLPAGDDSLGTHRT